MTCLGKDLRNFSVKVIDFSLNCHGPGACKQVCSTGKPLSGCNTLGQDRGDKVGGVKEEMNSKLPFFAPRGDGEKETQESRQAQQTFSACKPFGTPRRWNSITFIGKMRWIIVWWTIGELLSIYLTKCCTHNLPS